MRLQYFSFQTLQFLLVGQKNIIFPGAQGILAGPLPARGQEGEAFLKNVTPLPTKSGH